MPGLKLGKLPDRIPVKITITVKPALNEALHAYARAYEATYRQAEKVGELIPYMLQSFLDSDRNFTKAIRGNELKTEPVEPAAGARHRQRSHARSGAPPSNPDGES